VVVVTEFAVFSRRYGMPLSTNPFSVDFTWRLCYILHCSIMYINCLKTFLYTPYVMLVVSRIVSLCLFQFRTQLC